MTLAHSLGLSLALLLELHFIDGCPTELYNKYMQKKLILNSLAVLLVFAIYGGMVTHNRQKIMKRNFLLTRVLDVQTQSLALIERANSEVLLSMYPLEVAERVRAKFIGKESSEIISEQFEDVTVLFCAIADFAKYCSLLSNEKLLTFLSTIYTAFDNLIDNEENNVYKVETVNEVYMVVSGVQVDKNQTTAHAAYMALNMMATIQQLKQTYSIGSDPDFINAFRSLEVKIGLNSGPIMAGVIGQKGGRYKLFGDTVNTSSRMQSNSQPGKILVRV